MAALRRSGFEKPCPAAVFRQLVSNLDCLGWAARFMHMHLAMLDQLPPTGDRWPPARQFRQRLTGSSGLHGVIGLAECATGKSTSLWASKLLCVSRAGLSCVPHGMIRSLARPVSTYSIRVDRAAADAVRRIFHSGYRLGSFRLRIGIAARRRVSRCRCSPLQSASHSTGLPCTVLE